MKKTRAAIYYSTAFGRNDGPPLYYKNALEKLGFDVVRLVPQGDTRDYGKFDLHFWVDWGEDGLPVDHNWAIPEDGGKKIYVCSDAHIDGKGKKYRFDKAKKFDYAFFNQVRAADEFIKTTGRKAKEGHVVAWLPHAAEPKAYPHFEIAKKYDVCFIGHFQDTKNYNGFSRIDFLDTMFKRFPEFYFGTRNPQKPEVNMFEDASKKFCQSKVVLNISITDDINMRFFETLMSGSFLLTNWIPSLKNLEQYGFKEGVHYVTYRTLIEAQRIADYYITHDKEREKIASMGHKQALKTGTYQSRVKQILTIIK